MLKKSVLRTAVVLAASVGIGYLGLVRCSRDNPVDPKSNNYIPGTPPMAGFKADTVSCLATDSVNIAVTFSDTQGLGGKTPAVTRLYFNWDGGTSHADSAVVTGQTDSMTVRRAFPTPRNVIARVWALDNDSTFSPADSMRLIVRAGVLPEVRFLRDTVTGFINDSILIPVAWRDTQAYGGKTPAITKLYFNWGGDSNNLRDSVPVTGQNDSTVVAKVFWLIPYSAWTYVRARDNDGQLSPLDRMWLVIDQGKPRIDSASASADTVALGDSVTITASGTDTNGTVNAFVWTVGGRDTTTAAGVLRVLFMAQGTQFVIVKARDNDMVLSLPDTVRVRVFDRAGPDLEFLSYNSVDTVISSSSTVTVMVRTRDPSGILTVLINGSTAGPVDTTPAWPGWKTWQRDVTLSEAGPTTVMAWSWDKNSNQTSDSILLYYQRPDVTPPAIVFSTPQQGDTVRDTLNPSPVPVIVSVSDPSGVAWVRCNGIAMSNTSGSNYQLDVMLSEGRDSLVITSADTKGNNAVDTLFITYLVLSDITPPTMRIASPPPGRQITADSVLVIVYANDTSGPVRSGMASVRVNGVLASFNLVHYMATVPLVHGYDTLRAVAIDSSGNQRKDSIIVIRNIPPHFIPDVLVKDTTLWLDSIANIPICASDSEGDSMGFAFVTYPTKDALPFTIDTAGPGCARIAAYRPMSTGLDTFRVRVVDAFGSADTLKVAVTIIPKPTTKPYFTISTLPDTAILDSLYVVQLTAEDPQGLPLVYSLLPPTPSGVSISPAGLVTWTPSALGRDTIVAMVSNGIPESDTLQWVATVVLRDMPPVLRNPGDKTVTEGLLLQFNLAASDTNGDSLIYTFGSTYPAGASIDSLSGLFRWTPTYRQGGIPSTTYPTVFKVTEKNRSPALSDSVTIVIGVKDTNMPPVLVNPGSRTVNEGSALTFNLQATDINGDSIFFSISGPPKDSGAVISGNTFTWTPSVRAAGVYPVTYIATDNGSPVMRDSITDTITVVDATVPVFDLHPPVDTILVGFPYITTVSATDGDNDSLTYKKLAGPDSLFVNDSTGAVAWRPLVAGLNTYANVAVTAQDHAGNLDTIAWRILVLRWPRIYLGPLTNDTGYSVIQTRDGGYALCGSIATASSNLGFLIRTDTSGNAYVFQTYPGRASYVSLYSIQQTADNGFIMCGTDSSAGETKMLLIKTDPAGAVQWLKTISDSRLVYPSAKGTCVGLTSDGGFIACGAAIRRGIIGPLLAASDAYLVKTDPSGMVMWDSIYTNGTQASGAYSVQQTAPDKGYVFSGEIQASGSSGSDLYLVKTNSIGALTWARIYNRGVRDVGLSVQDINDGTGRTGYIIGGYSTNNISGATNGLLLRVNLLGDTVGGGWILSLKGNSVIASVRPVSDGNFIGCGFGQGNGEDVLLYKFAASDGSEIWSKLHGTSLNDRGYCAVETSDQGFILTGFVTIPGVIGTTTDVYLVKTDRNGVLSP